LADKNIKLTKANDRLLSCLYMVITFVIMLRKLSQTFTGLINTVKMSYIIYISPCSIQSLGVISAAFLLFLLNVLNTNLK